jgi:hypothetical protein
MASAYLTSNTGTATNAKKFTLSMWIKRSSLCDTNSQRFYQGYQDGNNRFYAMFDSTNSYPDSLWVYAVTGGSTQVYWYSARKFRDLNAWYHIVFSADSTQASQADRLKVYINGVEETSWTKTNNPSQNIDWGNQLAQTNNDLTLSGTESQTQPFDGQMAHVNFIDGTAYAPTVFGQTDTNTGIWTPKTSPSVTYGNNGYFLKFDNSGNMGLDSSGENNNFTTIGTIIQIKDTPSNVYAVLNSMQRLSSQSLTNVNSTFTNSSGGHRATNSTLAANTGKWYAEVKVIAQDGSATYPQIGIINPDKFAYNMYLGASDKGYGYLSNGNKQYNNSATSFGNTYTVGDIIGIAMDLDNHKLYFSKNGTWENSGVPTSGSTGTGSAYDLATGVFYSFAQSSFDGSQNPVYSWNFGNGYFGATAITSAGSNGNESLFEYDVPTGYYALNTKNLGTQS